jgi:triosephosphate isomerase
MGGNWKLNPTTVQGAQELSAGLAKLIGQSNEVDAIFFPPFPLLPLVKKELMNSRVHVRFFGCVRCR